MPAQTLLLAVRTSALARIRPCLIPSLRVKKGAPYLPGVTYQHGSEALVRANSDQNN